MKIEGEKTERKQARGARRRAFIKLCVFALLLVVFDVGASAQTTETIETVSINADLVDLNVSVFSRDPKTPVGDLQQKDFVVLENGQPEEISFFASSNSPFDLVLLVDLSGSTANKLDLIKKSLRRFVEASRPVDRIGIVTFSAEHKVVSPLTSDRDALFERIKKIEKPTGGTNFWDALYFVLKEMLSGASRRSAVVVMTDGVDNALPGMRGDGSTIGFDEVLDTVRRSDSIVIPIYLDTEREMIAARQGTVEIYADARQQLSQLALEGGGIIYQARRLEDLKGVYEQVIRDLSTVYSIGYRPTNRQRDGSWRSVTVQLQGRPQLAARTKRGYYAK